MLCGQFIVTFLLTSVVNWSFSKYVTKYPIFDFVRELHVLKKALGNKWLRDTTEIADDMQVHHAEHTRLAITNLKSLNGEVLSQASGT